MPSEKILEQKKQAVAELSAHLKESCVGVIVNYSGINVADDTKLRKELREADRKSTRLNSSHTQKSRMPSSA